MGAVEMFRNPVTGEIARITTEKSQTKLRFNIKYAALYRYRMRKKPELIQKSRSKEKNKDSARICTAGKVCGS